MSGTGNKRGRRLSANKTSDKTKKPRSSSAAAAAGTQSIAAAFLRTDEQKQESLQKLYTGKYILLKASAIYGGKSKVPSGKENYLFKYSVSEVEDDTSASIDYTGKYIVEGGQEWKSYPALDESDYSVEDYRLCCFKEDHALYNKYLGVVNKRRNDQADVERKRDEEEKRSAIDDVSDIQRKIVEEKVAPYDVLLAEFEPAGEPKQHVVKNGPDAGKVTQKQEWSEFCLFNTPSL